MIKTCKVCGQSKDFGRSRATTCTECLNDGYKWCSKCDTVHPVSSFSKSGSGLMNICKKCHNTRNVSWRHTEAGHAKALATHRKYRKDPVNRVKHVLNNQKHKSAGVLDTLTWFSTCECFDNSCAYCGATVKLTMDHVVPVTRGGSTSASNIVPACTHCNSSKGSKDMIEWYTAQPFYDKGKLEKILRFIKKGSGVQ